MNDLLRQRWQHQLEDLRQHGRYRQLALPRGLDFSSNDYLGLGKLTAPSTTELSRSGQASRLLRGHHSLWDDVETALAAWHGAESALVMNSGYCANEGLLSAIIEPGDFVASDACNHASIIDGIRLTRAERFVFRHNDLAHLEDGLRRAASQRRSGGAMFVVTEALFGMEGDRAPLVEMAALVRTMGGHLIVDEAHSTGCLGPNGSGLVDALGLRKDVLATVHTGGKALGVCGAYVCCTALLREMLVNRCRPLIFSTAPPPAVASWWLAMLPQVQHGDALRRELRRKVVLFREELGRGGIKAEGHDCIVPLILGDDSRAVKSATKIQAAGFDIRAIRPPTVPEGTARLRVSLHADHRDEDLLAAARCICEAVQY